MGNKMDNLQFVLCPGFVYSITDGDRHYLNTHRLADLYGVNHNECVLLRDDSASSMDQAAIDLRQFGKQLVFLRPLVRGGYENFISELLGS